MFKKFYIFSLVLMFGLLGALWADAGIFRVADKYIINLTNITENLESLYIPLKVSEATKFHKVDMRAAGRGQLLGFNSKSVLIKATYDSNDLFDGLIIVPINSSYLPQEITIYLELYEAESPPIFGKHVYNRKPELVAGHVGINQIQNSKLYFSVHLDSSTELPNIYIPYVLDSGQLSISASSHGRYALRLDAANHTISVSKPDNTNLPVNEDIEFCLELSAGNIKLDKLHKESVRILDRIAVSIQQIKMTG